MDDDDDKLLKDRHLHTHTYTVAHKYVCMLHTATKQPNGSMHNINAKSTTTVDKLNGLSERKRKREGQGANRRRKWNREMIVCRKSSKGPEGER